VFTAQYGLIPYIKQIMFRLKKVNVIYWIIGMAHIDHFHYDLIHWHTV